MGTERSVLLFRVVGEGFICSFRSFLYDYVTICMWIDCVFEFRS